MCDSVAIAQCVSASLRMTGATVVFAIAISDLKVYRVAAEGCVETSSCTGTLCLAEWGVL